MLRTILDREAWESYPMWSVRLNDGTSIFQNDWEIRKSSWTLLGEYLAERPTLSIESFSFGFRDNTREMPAWAEGYYFRHSVIGSFSGSKSSFLVGVLEGDHCRVEKWELPEMTFMWTENRPLQEAGLSLIKNP